jgi:hypothetical protein
MLKGNILGRFEFKNRIVIMYIIDMKKKTRDGVVPWNCRHAMSSGAVDKTLPCLGSSRDYRDSRSHWHCQRRWWRTDIEQRGIMISGENRLLTRPGLKNARRHRPFPRFRHSKTLRCNLLYCTRFERPTVGRMFRVQGTYIGNFSLTKISY